MMDGLWATFHWESHRAFWTSLHCNHRHDKLFSDFLTKHFQRKHGKKNYRRLCCSALMSGIKRLWFITRRTWENLISSLESGSRRYKEKQFQEKGGSKHIWLYSTWLRFLRQRSQGKQAGLLQHRLSVLKDISKKSDVENLMKPKGVETIQTLWSSVKQTSVNRNFIFHLCIPVFRSGRYLNPCSSSLTNLQLSIRFQIWKQTGPKV